MKFICAQCGLKSDKPTGAINRAKKDGYKIFCSRDCSSESRRFHRTNEEKKKLKKDYDKKFRELNETKIKKAKKEAFKKDYQQNPLKYKQERIRRKEEHKKYCNTPKYKEWKKEYDKKHLSKKNFGEFWESALLIREIESNYKQTEVREINNLHNKSQKRKRQWQQLQSSQQRI